MAITANVKNATSEKDAATVEEMQLFTVEFEAQSENFRDAAILLREAIGQVPSLSNSLLGNKPLCADALGINPKEHAEIRRFRTEEELQSYKAYMAGLMQRCQEGGSGKMPVFANAGERGFAYKVDSSRAYILFHEGTGHGCWVVRGMARFRNPSIAEKQLKSKGFSVRTISDDIKAAS